MTDNIAIKVENLTKTYRLYNSNVDRVKEALHPFRRKYHNNFNALSNVSFEIKKGETVGIIGKNGSGKSTLLKLITGVLTPTSGSVTVNGRISALLELGAGFNPELTGIENIYFNGTLMGYSNEEIATRLDDILAFADIGDFVHQPVKSYSSGMFLRLAFAVAINVDPDILIVDEALSVGDIKFQRKCISKIEDLKSKNKVILFVSHSPAVMNTLCSSAMLLEAGLLVSTDSPRVIGKMYNEIIFGEKSEAENAIESARADIGFAEGSNSCIIDSKKTSTLKQLVVAKLDIAEPVKSTQELRNGNGAAEIIDFGILDSNFGRTHNLKSGDKYSLFFRALFYEDISKVFASFLIRDVQGIELFFTNTEMLKISVPSQKRGQVLEVTADIEMWLAPGHYFLSFVVLDRVNSDYLDRRLDAYHFEVTTDAVNGGGYVNLNSVIQTNSLIPLPECRETEQNMTQMPQSKYYSQHGEDVMLDIIFNGLKEGYFVEVGCIDGRRFSNTLTFEERGWKGICIEAHTGYIEMLQKNRPNSIIVHCAVGDKDEKDVNFYANSRGSLSTLDPNKEGYFRKKFGHWFTGFETQIVPKKKLDTIFEELGVSKINLLSIDIEGTEIEALRGMNVEKWKPDVILIEIDATEEKHIEELLIPIGYRKIFRIANNSFYSLLDLKDFSGGNKICAEIIHTQHPLDSDGDKIIAVELFY